MDTTFKTVLPALRAVDNGDGTFSMAISLAGGVGDLIPIADDTHWLGSDTKGWKGLKFPDLKLYQLDANHLSLENIAGGTYKNLLLGNVFLTAGGGLKSYVNNGLIYFQGAVTAVKAAIIRLSGADHVSTGRIDVSTPNAAADAAVDRLIISGKAAIAVATWFDITHTGIVLSGALNVAGQYLTFLERAAPGAGAANEVRMYAIVDGGTLTDMACVFQDGTVDIFAQEVTPLDAPTFTYPSGTVTNLVLRKEHPGLVKLVAVFPNGEEFVLKEIEYHDPKKIVANKGTEHPLPDGWLVEDAMQRATRLAAERAAELSKKENK